MAAKDVRFARDARERFSSMRAQAQMVRVGQTYAAPRPTRRPLATLTAFSGRLLAAFGRRMAATGESRQQRAAAHRRLLNATQRPAA